MSVNFLHAAPIDSKFSRVVCLLCKEVIWDGKMAVKTVDKDKMNPSLRRAHDLHRQLCNASVKPEIAAEIKYKLLNLIPID